MKTPIALACVLALCAPVFADGPTVTVPTVAPVPAIAPPSNDSIEKLLVAMNVQSMVSNMQARANTAMKAGMQNALKLQVSTPEQQKVMDDLATKISSEIGDELSWAKMKPLYMQVYSETFTQEEIDGLTQFYQSPTGKVFVSKVPLVMDKTTALMQVRIQPMIQNIQRSIAASAQEIQNLKPKPTPVAPMPTMAPKS
jgi:hypothetical protein